MRKRNYLSVLTALLIMGSCGSKFKSEEYILPSIQEEKQGISFATSDSDLQAQFDWALDQALFYAHDGSDAVGKWYEAALPERFAFCMRDVSHQSNGANVIGLQAHNKNMLFKFAENINESRDWCSYWEINKWNQPAPVDYASDEEFWYNLPANFDVLNSCYRQYQWTGDTDYIEDSVFLNFYHHTMTSYIDRWQLGLDQYKSRDRFINAPKPLDKTKAFQTCRGIPGYDENEPLNFFYGSDMFAIQYQAFNSYSEIMKLRGESTKAAELLKKAEEIKTYFNSNWWNEKEQSYYSAKHVDGSYTTGASRSSLFSGIANYQDRHIGILSALTRNSVNVNVESLSYYPQTFYDFDANEAAYQVIMDIKTRKRKAYPEVSFGVVEAIVKGMMGLEVEASNRQIKTMSRLSKNTEWAEFTNIPVFENTINIKHDGYAQTEFTNVSGGVVTWRAAFPETVASIEVDGEQIAAENGVTRSAKACSWVTIEVSEGQTVVVNL